MNSDRLSLCSIDNLIYIFLFLCFIINLKCLINIREFFNRMSQFSKVIRQARKASNLTQKELAKCLDIDSTYLSKLENNRFGIPPSEELIKRLSKALNLNYDDIRYLSGRLTCEEIETFHSFVKHNYKYMSLIFEKMKKEPDFLTK